MPDTIPDLLRRWADKAPGEIESADGIEFWLLDPNGPICGNVDTGDGDPADFAHLLAHALDCMEARGWYPALHLIHDEDTGEDVWGAYARRPEASGVRMCDLPPLPPSDRLLAVLLLNDKTLYADAPRGPQS